MTAFDNILKRLSNQEIILPIFENQIRAQDWPEKYTVEIDSSPYYGSGDGYFHPSSHPLMDERLLYYLFHPATAKLMVPENFSLQREMTLAVGKSLHAIVQAMMVRTGLVKPENVEREFIIREHHVRGKIDFIVDHPTRGPILVDMKTMTHYKFGKHDFVKPEWEAQVSLGLDSQGLEHGMVLLVESGYPFRLKEFQVARNDALLSEIYSKFDRVREAIAFNSTPIPCCAPTDKRVSSCPAQFVCWRHPQGPR